MQHSESAFLFRREAESEGITSDNLPVPVFHFDLNLGSMTVTADVHKVHRLVSIARDHASNETAGEHIALLSLVTRRIQLQDEHVYWRRAHHVDTSTGEWISLSNWLQENRMPYKPRQFSKV